MINIFLSGNARSGKDYFCELLSEKLTDMGYICRRLSFADELKAEVHDFLINSTGISPFTDDDSKKSIIRPFLIGYGTTKRLQTNGKYWLDKVKNKITDLESFGLIDVVIVTDVRFDESESDETEFARKNGMLLYIERVTDDGLIVPPASHGEAQNNPKIKEKAFKNILWGSGIDAKKVVSDFVEECISDKLHKPC